MDRPILVAADGSAGALGALRVAAALARRGTKPARVLAVQEPVPFYDDLAPGLAAEVEAALGGVALERLREAVRGQLDGLGGAAAEWDARVEVGSPAAAIADTARELGAGLIVLGLGRHSVVERWFGGETALRVMQLAHVPVLAVHPEATDLPRRALVAEDFGELGRDAGLLARDLLAPGGELHLAHALHVPPAPGAEFLAAEWIEGYLESVSAQLEEERRELAATGVEATSHVLQGNPASELLRLAGRLEADLIAAGRHGRGFLGRLVMGSVSTRLVRRARCSVLVVPPPLPAAGAAHS